MFSLGVPVNLEFCSRISIALFTSLPGCCEIETGSARGVLLCSVPKTKLGGVNS